MIVDVEREERYWYPDDGGIVWLAGFQPVAPDGRFLGRDAPELAAAGLRIAGVAGAARHHADALASGAVDVPVIASGGVGEPQHLVDGFAAGADAALCASIFHYGQHTVAEAKAHLAAAGIAVRA